MNKKIIFLVIGILILSGCGAKIVKDSDDKIYYSKITYADNLLYDIYEVDLKTKTKELISNRHLNNITYHEGFLYGISDNNLVRVKPDGTSFKKLSEAYVKWYEIYDNYIYFGKDNNNASDDIFEKFARINLDGSKELIINDYWVSEIIADKNGLFVVYYDALLKREIIHLDYDGKEIKKLGANANLIYKFGEYLYYTSSTDSNKLYQIKIDGTDNIKLLDISLPYSGNPLVQGSGSPFYGIANNNLYYINLGDASKPYRLNLTDLTNEKLNDDMVTYLGVFGDNIYFKNNIFGNMFITNDEFSTNEAIVLENSESWFIK